MTSRGSAVERLTLEELKVLVPKSVEDMVTDARGKVGGLLWLRGGKCEFMRMSGNYNEVEEEGEIESKKKEDYRGVWGIKNGIKI